MKKLILISEYYPFTNNYETFLENEVIYLSQQKYFEVTILPMNIHKVKREVPKNIIIDISLANEIHKLEKNFNSVNKIIYLFKSLFDHLFWNEIKLTKFKINKIKELLFSLRKLYLYKKSLKKIISKTSNSDIIFYTYWYTEMTYALQLEEKDLKSKIVTRTHGYDLYEYRTLTKYMPLRRSITKNLDKIYTITLSANNYIKDTYGINEKLLTVSPLGVMDKNVITNPSSSNKLIIVSCSALTPVKKVSTLIDSLKYLSEKRKNIEISWYHIGTGWMEKEITTYAENKLLNIKNLNFKFLGFLKNNEIYDFYKNNEIDVFINVSDSEGVPVSIMEAMSCHIPIIAPNIGGISDMIKNGENGILLSSKPSIEEISKAINNFELFKNKQTRYLSRQKYLELYNAKTNYENFIKNLNEIYK